MKKTIIGLLVLGLFVFSSFMMNVAKADETVRVGVLYPLSGKRGFLGTECLRGTQILTDMINDSGGLWGKKIKLVIGDALDLASPPHPHAPQRAGLTSHRTVPIGHRLALRPPTVDAM